MHSRLLYRLATLAVVLAFAVIILGVYTRLTDAGLGCPDWPGCYGQLTAPGSPAQVAKAEIAFPGNVIQTSKAWTEMVHRYFAGILGILVFAIAIIAYRKRQAFTYSVLFPFILASLVIFQAILGMWTVTWKLLPLVVMGHLLGGMILFSFLWWLRLRTRVQRRPYMSLRLKGRIRPWAILGLMICFCQIALGGWVSANYAGLACVGFPSCNGILLPHLNFASAFNLFTPIAANYQGGVLDNSARITIQMVHRFGGIITGLYVGGFALYLLSVKSVKSLRSLGGVMLLLLVVQFVLGIINVTKMLPLPAAVLHNGIAALLFITLLTVGYRVSEKGELV